MKLEINNLSVDINNTRILDSVSLCIEEKEFLVLLGPSGCGKSTLLKTIAGINSVTEGSMVLDGTLLNDVPAHKRGTVIVFQDIRLFPNMSVAENVTYALKVKGVRKNERREKARELLGYVQLDGFEDRMPSTLSGGQMQRVALARALAAEPKLMLLDEPFSSLDENLREDMRSLVADLHRRFGMTTIMVTHDREEAFSMADRLAVMFEGHIVQTGTPEEVLSDPADDRVRRYFGKTVLQGN
ncbi:MAG: ABC transporter ATP-binding protein [Mogibacterium sp.]|nr:ABC transporter ATP-binding protein [Mogibacterium sp.]